MLELTGLRLGMIGLLCMAFLFLPVARGSVLLRLIDIPFEHATRYHVWLGHLTMVLFTLHGLFYVIAWDIQGRLVQEVSPQTLGIFLYLLIYKIGWVWVCESASPSWNMYLYFCWKKHQSTHIKEGYYDSLDWLKYLLQKPDIDALACVLFVNF